MLLIAKPLYCLNYVSHIVLCEVLLMWLDPCVGIQEECRIANRSNIKYWIGQKV
jgi:hypothetical protein